jgi:RNA polymerase sigma-70 factor (ECF subfamily)
MSCQASGEFIDGFRWQTISLNGPAPSGYRTSEHDLTFDGPSSNDGSAAAAMAVAPAGHGLSAMLVDAQDESSLVDRLLAGDADAVGEVYDLHQAAVHAFARRLVGDAAAAQDLVHDVFIALPSAMRNFRGESSFRTFLLSIAVNRARHHLRAASRRRAAMDRFSSDVAHRQVDDSPERLAQRRDLARELSRALDALPLDQRVAFVLCEIEERTSVEAAEIVGAPEETVRTRLFYAKKKLREELKRRGLE